jgi:hypothetical protein
MKINNLLKLVVISGGIYAISNMCYQYGKGHILKLMKECDISVDEAMEIVENDTKSGPLSERFNWTIIKIAAKPKQYE